MEPTRRMLLKISTGVMISIVGPASAWSVAQEFGLMLYILTYMTSKHMSSYVASRSTQIAIFSYRHAPLLLIFSGLLSIFPGSLLTFAVIMPFLLGCYEGAYWAVYFDYKPWFKKVSQSEKEGFFLSEIHIGISRPSSEFLQKAKLTSVPYAICQFVLQNSMRFVALERGVLWLGALVVIAELSSYYIVKFYEKITQKSTSREKTQRKLWVWGQIVVLVGIVLMIAGHSFELFMLFLIGWLISQGSAKGCLRKIEIEWSQKHLSGIPSEIKRNPDLERFQRNEVFAAVLAVIIATWLAEQNQYPLDAGVFGAFFALTAFMLRFPKFIFDYKDEKEFTEIGLRERLKFKSHFLTTIMFIVPAIVLSIKSLVLLLLLFGFLMAIVAVIWAEDSRAFPSAI
jgi:diacylglycerol kinase